MIRRILVAFDGSEPAARAFAFGAELAAGFAAELAVLAVIELPEPAPRAETEAILEAGREYYDQAFAELRRRVPERCPRCRFETVVGHPAEWIVRFAEDERVDLIVLGRRGTSVIKSWLMGSISERVLRSAQCPVAVVPPVAPPALPDVSSTVTVGTIMSRDLAIVARATPVRQVVEAMVGKIYRAVVVVDAGRPVGVITNSDLVTRGGLAVRMELLPSLPEADRHEALALLSEQGQTAADIMTPDPVTVTATETLADVAAFMARRRLKRLPVVDEQGALIGVVSRLDLLRTVARGDAPADAAPPDLGLSGDLPVARAMRADVPTVHPDSPLPEVMQAVIATRLNRAVVVDDQRRVVGIVTDAELIERVTPALRPSALRSLMNRLPFAHTSADAQAADQHANARVAADLMDTDVATVRADAPLREAIAAMLDGAHKLVAVVDGENRLVGVVDRADLLHSLVGQA